MIDFFDPPEYHNKTGCGENRKEISEFLEEVAYHEAGHFVTSNLISTISKEFNPPDDVTICVVVDKEFNNKVHSPTSEFLKKQESENGHTYTRRVYNKYQLDRCFLLLIRILAGFSTFRVFYGVKDKKFIHYPYSGNKSILEDCVFLEYITIRRVLYCASDFAKSHDISQAISILKHGLEIFSLESISFILNSLVSSLDSILIIPEINQSIELVKTEFIQKNGIKINKDQIENLNSVVSKKMKSISLEKHLIEFKDLIHKLDKIGEK